MKLSTCLFPISLMAFCLIAFFPFYQAYAQWQQTNGPMGGGMVLCLETDQTGQIFAIAAGAGLYKSSDNGESWTWLTNNVGSSLVVSPSGILFTNRDGVSRSYDQGLTWETANQGLNGDMGEIRSIQTLAVDQDGILYGGVVHGTEGPPGVFVSHDDGDSWVFYDINPTNYMEYIELVVNSQGVVYLGSNEMLKMSVDKGQTWEDLNHIPAIFGVSNLTFDTAGNMFAANRWDMGVYRTSDNATTWDLVSEEEASSISINSDNEVFLGTRYTGMRRSTDGGISWDTINNGLPNQALYCLLSTLNSVFIGGMSIYRSINDGNAWEEKVEGMVISRIKSMTVDNDGAIYAIGSKVWRSDDSGGNWVNISDTVTGEYTKVMVYGNDIYLATNGWIDGRLLKSSDKGENWEQISSFENRLIDLEFSQSGDVFAIMENIGILKSTDLGYNWLPTGFPQSYYNDVEINSEGTILASEQAFPYYIYRSDDGGASANTTYTEFINSSVEKIIAGNDGHFFIASDGNLYRSQDNGYTWANVTNLFPGIPYVNVVEADYQGILYAGDYNDFYRSEDFGLTWSIFSEGEVTLPPVMSFASSPETGILYAGTSNRGVWMNGLYVDVTTMQAAHNLSIYPNPATDQITISFPSFNPAVQTVLSIYDVQGGLIRNSLINSSTEILYLAGMKPGVYLVSVNGQKATKVLIR